MVADAAIETVLELLASVFDRQSGSSASMPDVQPEALALSAREHEIAVAIQARRGVSLATAEDLVRWLRTQGADTDARGA